MKRSESERIRIRHHIERMRATLSALEAAISENVPPGPDVSQAVAHAGVDLGCSISKLEAYMRAEEDKRLEEEGAQDIVWATRASFKRCEKCGEWLNSPKCQAAKAV